MRRATRFLRGPLGAGLAGGLIVALLGWLGLATGLIEAEPASGGATSASASSAGSGEGAALERSRPASEGAALTPGDVYEQDGPAIAYIEADVSGPTTAAPFGPPQGGGGTATGSGFLFDDSGHVLTNAHVVDGADSVTVVLGTDGEPLDAKVLGSDDSTDVAVLEVDPSKVEAQPLETGDSSAASVGDGVIAIGNPFGLDLTVTTGIVSALQRQISAPDGFTISDVLQTDAAINPGNSGGPLIDTSGRVIGINSQIATDRSGGSTGIGFAVPIDTAEQVAAQIIDTGAVEHAYLGVSGTDLDPEIADALNLGAGSGALVQEVTPGGPADEAGLEAGDATIQIHGREVAAGGDLITAVDGKPVEGMADLIAIVNDRDPGDEVTLTVERDGESRELTAELGERPAQAAG